MSPTPPKPRPKRRPRVVVRPNTRLPIPARVLSRPLRAVVSPAPVAKPAVQAEGLVRDIAKRRARIAEDFYEIGVALEKLSKPKLYKSLGYVSFEKLLQARRVMSRVQAVKLISVAQAYPKKLALRLGVEKGYALIRYTAATPAVDVARILASANALVGGKRVLQLSAKELRDETKRLTSGPAPSDEDVKAARRSARELQRRLRAKGAKSAKVRAERDGARWKLQIEVDASEADLLG